MNAEPQCPDLIPSVLAYTSEVATARPWGIVTGTGKTPEEALGALCRDAGDKGEEIFRQLWKQNSQHQWRTSVTQKAGNGVKLKASFSIGSTRLAHGASGWVAYGTLFTDSTGDGTCWLQPEGGNDGQ
jgi:hypothetical protein